MAVDESWTLSLTLSLENQQEEAGSGAESGWSSSSAKWEEATSGLRGKDHDTLRRLLALEASSRLRPIWGRKVVGGGATAQLRTA